MSGKKIDKSLDEVNDWPDAFRNLFEAGLRVALLEADFPQQDNEFIVEQGRILLSLANAASRLGHEHFIKRVHEAQLKIERASAKNQKTVKVKQ